MRWQAYAACLAATDPQLFDEPVRHDAAAVEAAREVAEVFCSQCPVILRCAQFADQARHEGLYGGTLRIGPTTKYRRLPLIQEAPHLPLDERRDGASNEWGAA